MSKAQATGTSSPTTVRSALAALILATALVPTPAPAAAASASHLPTGSAPEYTSAPRTIPQLGEPTTTTITGGGIEAEAVITEVTGRYERAGLALPNLRIHVHESYDECLSHQGLYGRDGDLYRVDICNLQPAIVGHELAHAWEHHNVTDATRRSYLDRLGSESWNDQQTPPQARSMEKAAWLIEWGIRREPIQPMLATYHADALENYELLTGSPSPRIAHWSEPIRQDSGYGSIPLPYITATAVHN